MEALGARRCEDGEVEALRHLDLCDAARTDAEARAQRLDEEVVAARRARGELAGDLREVEARMHALKDAGDAPRSSSASAPSPRGSPSWRSWSRRWRRVAWW